VPANPNATGVSPSEILTLLTNLEAQGEINNVPPSQLDPIIAKARAALNGGTP